MFKAVDEFVKTYRRIHGRTSAKPAPIMQMPIYGALSAWLQEENQWLQELTKQAQILK